MTFRDIRNLIGLSRTAFAKKYNIPLRSLENWELGKSHCPEYVSELLEQCISLNLYALPITGEPLTSLRKAIGISRTAFSKKYHIPLRTLEDWELGKRHCPGYVSELIERCVRHYDLPLYFCLVTDSIQKKSYKYYPGGENHLIHADKPYYCIPENLTFEIGYLSKDECELEKRRQIKILEKYQPWDLSRFKISVVRAEDLIEIFLQKGFEI